MPKNKGGVQEGVGAGVVTIAMLGAPMQREIKGWIKPLTVLARDYGEVKEKASVQAPKVMELFKRFSNSAPEGSTWTLADFARLFDATVPIQSRDGANGPGYLTHRMYYTIAYMRQIQRGKDRKAKAGNQGEYSSAKDRFVRSIATMTQLLKDPGPLYVAIARNFDIKAKALQTLKNRVAKAEPFLNLKGLVKPFAVDGPHATPIVPAELTAAGEAAAEGGEVAQKLRKVAKGLGVPGQRVRRAA